MVEPCRAESASVADSANNIDVGVSPRKVNCWQKVWGGLIPTYASAFSDLFKGGIRFRCRTPPVSYG